MTVRAVIIGLLGAAFVGAVGYFNDVIMRQTHLFSSYMPLLIFGLMILFVTFANPLLRRISSRATLSGSEIALIVAIILPAGYISSLALMHRLSDHIMAPRHISLTEPGWQKHNLLDRVPPLMFAGVPPEFAPDDVREAVSVCSALAGRTESAGPAEAAVRAALDGRDRKEIERELSAEQPDAAACRSAASTALNRMLARRDLFDAADFPAVALPSGAGRLFGDEPLAGEKVRRVNRELLDIVYSGRITSLSAKEDIAVKGFRVGLSTGRDHIAVSQVPWYAWRRTLVLFWIPAILAFCAVFMGLALVVHRRWSEQEHCPYPIATFARGLLPGEGGALGAVLTSRLFWGAAITIALFHLLNYAYSYWPQYLVQIPRRFDFGALADLFPVMKRGGVARLLRPTIYFTAIGLAYFMASDVSFSMGIAPFVYALVLGVFAGYGVSLSGGWYNMLRTDLFICAGAYFGLFFVILYTGRHHYAAVFRRSLALRARDEVRPHEVLGARIFIVSSLIFTILCALVGIKIQWAVLFLAMLVMTYVAVGRIIAESGLFWIHPHIFPTVLLWGALGAKVLGPQQMFLLFLVGAVFSLGFAVNVLPLFDQGLQLTQKRPGRTAGFGAAAVVVALLVALPVSLYLQYDFGSIAGTYGANRRWIGFAFDPIVAVEDRLASQGVLAEAGKLSGLGWFGGLAPHWPGVLAFVAGLALVLGAEALRLRTTWWPIHPILFICAGWWHSQVLGVSFLIGWIVKKSVVKYGGDRAYNRLKPLMWGLIAGDMIAGCTITVIGAIYYFVTGTAPNRSWIIPA